MPGNGCCDNIERTLTLRINGFGGALHHPVGITTAALCSADQRHTGIPIHTSRLEFFGVAHADGWRSLPPPLQFAV